MDRSKRADPPTEKPPEQHRQHNGRQPPKEALIKRSGRQQGTESDQGVELKEPVNRPAAKLPPFFAKGCNNAKPQEQGCKKKLGSPSDGYYFHRRVDLPPGINRLK